MLYLGEKCGLVNSYQVSAPHCPPGPIHSGSNNHFFFFLTIIAIHSLILWTCLVKRLGKVLMGVLMDFGDIVVWRLACQKKYVLFCCCDAKSFISNRAIFHRGKQLS